MRQQEGASPTAGAIVPHAPLLLPAVSGEDTHPEVGAVRHAAARLDPGAAEMIVVLSPHGAGTAVYSTCSGDLADFGVDGVTVDCDVDAAAAERLASAWNVPLVDTPVDHGILVPLELTGLARVPVVPACLSESPDPNAADLVLRFVEALGDLSGSRRVLFVASANTSAGLAPRAPLTELPGARDLEAGLHDALERDPGTLDGLAQRLEEVGGSCSRGPLAAFGALFAGRPAQVLTHVWPFGVGYMVAVAATVRG